jgi:hypothetical protein
MKNPLDTGNGQMSSGPICVFVVTGLDGPTPRR